MQIIVLGMHRAGTSLTTRMINMMGAYFAPEGLSLGFNKDNPKGFWERRDVLQINKSLLHHQNCTWYKLDSWSDEAVDSIPPQMKRAIKTVVMEMDAHRPWVLKDPRMCVTLPAWRPYLEAPVAVIAYRDPLEVVRSLELRNALPFEYGMALWEFHVVKIIKHAYALPKVFTSYDTMLTSPIEATQALYNGLVKQEVQGLRMPSEREILAFIEPKLKRAHKDDTRHVLSDEQKHLAAILRGEKAFDTDVKMSKPSRHILESMGNVVTGSPVNH